MSAFAETFPLALDALVEGADDELRSMSGNALLRVTDNPLEIGAKPVDDHPLDDLLGFTAAADWLAVGVRTRGKAHFQADFDLHHGYHQVWGGSAEPTPVTFTTLVDRHGRGAGLIREGDNITRLDGPPDGTLGDACKRVLGLPTPPAPPTTAELWLRIWLDRVVEAATFPGKAEDLLWDDIAVLHPAWTGSLAADAHVPASPGDDPQQLVEATLGLADQWPWARLKRDPEVLDSEDGPLPDWVVSWMDEGMFARWTLTDVGPLPLQLNAAHQLLTAPQLDDVAEVILSTGLAEPL